MSVSTQMLRTVVRASFCVCRFHQSVLHKTARNLGSVQRFYSSEPLPLPNQDEKQYSPKIQEIVKDISQLTLLEVADLNELLKKTLKIQDAPVMAMGAPVAAQPVEDEDEKTEVAPKKSTFTVKLVGVEEGKKIALIKEVKALLPDTNLVQAKKFVESTPVVVKGDLSKDEAEELMKTLEKAGGKSVME